MSAKAILFKCIYSNCIVTKRNSNKKKEQVIISKGVDNLFGSIIVKRVKNKKVSNSTNLPVTIGVAAAMIEETQLVHNR
ncbi:hypothetical protein [Radiobacillus sp. PE A8.2]|uniref:hypothetical protein n=1 Tax=Radiobacillus sp. PE A8.2 TaxID=3380349 RepID=UPI0038904D7F